MHSIRLCLRDARVATAEAEGYSVSMASSEAVTERLHEAGKMRLCVLACFDKVKKTSLACLKFRSGQSSAK
jgi:hypothetical protein